MIDPYGQYSIVAANLTVIVANQARLNGLPCPRKWEDLLKPDYNKSIVLGGRPSKIDETLLLTIYKNYGENGVAALRKSVRDCGVPPSKMIQEVSSNKRDLPSLYIMSKFHAHIAAQSRGVKIIWPADGALVTPLIMLVRSDKIKEFKELIDFWQGEQIGRIFASAHFFSTNSKVDNHLSKGCFLNWLGWDFIKNSDINAKMNVIDAYNGSVVKTKISTFYNEP